MHSLGKRVLAWAVVCCMAVAPALAASKPLGMVLGAEKARLGNGAVQAGTNVYVGDSATTDKTGALLMKLGNAQVNLGGDSQATFQESDGRVTAYLNRGTLSFSVQGEEAVLVYAAGAWIRAQSTASTSGEISIVNPNELLVTSRGGALEIIVENETTVVPQDQTARVNFEPDRNVIEGAGKNAGRKQRIVARILTAAGIAAIVTCSVLFNTGHSNLSVSPAQIRGNGHCY